MTVTLKIATRQGERVYIWHDGNGKEWRVYQSFNLWRYRREDHDISSIGYLMMEDARSALERAQEASSIDARTCAEADEDAALDRRDGRVTHASARSTIAYGSTRRCDGWPHCGCPNEATEPILGYELCEDCARAFVAPARFAFVAIPGVELGACCPYCAGPHILPRCPAIASDTGTPLIAGLREQLATLHDALGTALFLLRSGGPTAAIIVLEDARKGGAR